MDLNRFHLTPGKPLPAGRENGKNKGKNILIRDGR